MADPEVVVDGVRLGPKSDFVELFRRQFRGDVVFESKSAYGPADGVVRVLGAARNSRLEARVRDAILTLARDEDPEVRGGAVMAIGTYPRIFGTSALLELLETNIQLFRNVPTVARGYADLEWELLQAVAATAPTAPEIIDRFKGAVFDQANGQRFIGFVTRADPPWMLEHAKEVVAGHASRVDGILAGLPDSRARENYVKALRAEPQEFRREVIGRLSKTVPDPVERERLAKLLSD